MNAIEQLNKACKISVEYNNYCLFMYNSNFIYISDRHANIFNLPAVFKVDSEEYKTWKKHLERFVSKPIKWPLKESWKHEENIEFANNFLNGKI